MTGLQPTLQGSCSELKPCSPWNPRDSDRRKSLGLSPLLQRFTQLLIGNGWQP